MMEAEPTSLTEIEIAYLAGLLEGEGCFQHEGNRGKLRVNIGMVDRDIIERVHTLFKKDCPSAPPIIHDRRSERYPRHSDQYIARVNGDQARHFMKLVLLYMGERRGAKIRECLDCHNVPDLNLSGILETLHIKEAA